MSDTTPQITHCCACFPGSSKVVPDPANDAGEATAKKCLSLEDALNAVAKSILRPEADTQETDAQEVEMKQQFVECNFMRGIFDPQQSDQYENGPGEVLAKHCIG